MSIEYALSYYPWITQGISASQIASAVEVFASALERQLAADMGQDVAIRTVLAPDIPPQIDQLVAESRHIALINPLGYVFARARSPKVDVVAVALRPDANGNAGPTYRAQWYATKKSA